MPGPTTRRTGKLIVVDATGWVEHPPGVYRVRVDLTTADDGFVATCPALPDARGQGASEDEALAAVGDAIAGSLRRRKQQGQPNPPLNPDAIVPPGGAVRHVIVHT